jgi:hypothetical protein
VSSSSKGLLAATLVALALRAGAAGPAAAAGPCWKTLLNDWYDGRIDHTYPISCYDAALKHLPPDVQQYSSARDDIERALLDAKARDHSAGRAETPSTLVPAQTRATTRLPATSGRTTTSGVEAVSVTYPATTTPLPGNRPANAIARLADRLNPASPTSLPVPLIVLAGLAVVLVAAGGVGVLVRRSQGRS